jgi:hypothetical protein
VMNSKRRAMVTDSMYPRVSVNDHRPVDESNVASWANPPGAGGFPNASQSSGSA